LKPSQSHAPNITATPVDTPQSGPLPRAEIATILGIPAHLVREVGRDSGERDGELHISYLKYQTALQAVATMAKMVKDGEWQGKKLAELDVVDLVISRSMWYSHYKILFPKTSRNHPDMLNWLKETADAPSDLEIWGMEKGIYRFSDLTQWLQGKEEEGIGKGKGKISAKMGKTVQKDDAPKENEEKKSKKKKRKN
jgi:hypothetical protein